MAASLGTRPPIKAEIACGDRFQTSSIRIPEAISALIGGPDTGSDLHRDYLPGRVTERTSGRSLFLVSRQDGG